MKSVPIVVVIVLLLGCSPATIRKPALCELSTDRGKYTGQVLTMTGELLVSDHGSAIEDPECDKGIPIQWQDEDVPNMREFDAVAQRVLALEPVIVTVRVTGKMSKASRSEFFDEPYWYLDLVSADVLSVREGS